MARYTPEFLAALQQRYEETDQPMRSLAAEFEIGISTLSSLVEKQSWTKRSQRQRDCPPTLRNVLAEAEALAALPPPERGRACPGLDPRSDGEAVRVGVASEQTPTPTLPLAGGGSPAVPGAEGEPTLSPAERLEALVVKEIAAEEATRAELETRPRARGESERCARTLSILTQTLHTLQRLPGGQGSGTRVCDCDDDMPEDMDAFRDELARRIDAFVASRTGENDLEAAEDEGK
jgi:transposase-like protein